MYKFIIIGEAASRLSNDFKISNKDINWNRMKGLRNRIAHDYFGIDTKIIWETISVYLKEELNKLKAIENV